MTGTDPRAARKRLGAMLRALLAPYPDPSGPVPGLSPRTLQRWCLGTSAPNDRAPFWPLLDHYAPPGYDRLPWRLALDAARHEAQEQQHRWQRPGAVHPRTAMDAFARSTDADAPAYLWWHAELPSGKSTLLADYEYAPAPEVDARYQAVSAEAGTHTRPGFLRALHDLLDATTAAEDTARLLREAADRTRAAGHRLLLLLIDDLDADPGWPPHPAVRSTLRHPGPPSIAALLPARLPDGVRIVITTRRTDPLPPDLPAEHPLRLRECCRALAPAAGLPPTAPTASRFDGGPLHREILAFLTCTKGGLRPQDLAQLTGAPAEEIGRLLTHRGNRTVITDPRTPGAFRPAPNLPAAEARSGDGGHTTRLHGWAASFRNSNWPSDTPPYLLGDYLGLLEDPAEQAAFLHAPERQRRLADTLGPELALAQLPDTELLFTAARDLLRRRLGPVPTEAPAVLALLGELPHARALAHAVPTRPARAAALAHLAAALAEVDRHDPTATVLAEEAGTLFEHTDPYDPRTPQTADACAELADAARALARLGHEDAARPLFLAVARSGAADLATRVEAMAHDPDAPLTALLGHALALAEDRPEYAQVAADILRTVARTADKPLRTQALTGLTELTSAPDPEHRLAAAAARAVEVSALAEQGFPRRAVDALRTVWDLLTPALVAPLTPADRAHLRLDLSATFTQVALAERAAVHGPRPERSIRLLDAHRAAGRTGVLRDDQTEQARAALETTPDGAPGDTPFARARRTLLTGNPALARAQADTALRALRLDGPTPFAETDTLALLRALGTVGALTPALRLLRTAPDAETRAARHAALSLGCALGGHPAQALAQARTAARLLTDHSQPATRRTVAQALAHGGDPDRALSLADPADAPLVAAGLRSSDPDRAIALADTAARALLSRRLRPLATLLLAHPSPDRPTGALPGLLRTASRLTTRPHRAEPVILLTLLHRVGAPLDPATTARLPQWQTQLRAEHARHTERALLAALDRDPDAVLRLAATAPDRTTRLAALTAGAKVLSGAPTALDADDPLTSLCQALRPAPDPSPARPLFDALLRDGAWTHALPLLPALAPENLPPLGDLLAAHSRPT
ncbi:hypothetical protein AB0O31_29360 [Kitasatospora cineracea]|uniref:hypothetical protein n=1 Tax=Kitasatospora cineracea TaxID=88074 RepID=UPI00341A5151